MPTPKVFALEIKDAFFALEIKSNAKKGIEVILVPEFTPSLPKNQNIKLIIHMYKTQQKMLTKNTGYSWEPP